MARIAAREAEIEAGIDPDTVRSLIEHMATVARTSADGLGPLSPEQITDAFTTVCGYAPDDRGAVLLQRLPGLGGHSSESGARVFIDTDFAEAARAGSVYSYIENPFTSKLNTEGWQAALSSLGAEVASARCNRAQFTAGKITTALEQCLLRRNADTLAADVVLVLIQLGFDYAGSNAFIRDVHIPELSLDSAPVRLGSLEFQDCIISRLELPPDLPARSSPAFVRCYFGLIEGRTGLRDLPTEFIDATVDHFENEATTTNDILALSLPLGTKVVLTILKKLYAQRGSGRRENALYRGLDLRGRQLVPQALNLLRRHDFVARTKQGDQVVWIPTKSADARRRALAMIAAPNAAKDRLLDETRELD